MKNYSVAYYLISNSGTLAFNSEKDACAFLGVTQCTVASCYKRNSRCKGYIVKRGEITTHHATNTRLFKIWEGMRERCSRLKHPHYKDYGGRGISICDEWNEFNAFHDWAAQSGYRDNLTIDRIDVNGNYEPSNCRWVTISEQMRNKRTNHMVWIDDTLLTLSECSRNYGVPKSTIRWREEHNRDIITGIPIVGARMYKEEDE